MAQSRPFYMWRVSREHRFGSLESTVFNDRRDAEKLFRQWREDMMTLGSVELSKVWSQWNRKAICSMLNGDPDEVESVKERPTFKYVEKAWKEHLELIQFRMGGQHD